jgi:hypothetical protein
VSISPTVPYVTLLAKARPVPSPDASSTEYTVTFTITVMGLSLVKPTAGRNVTDPSLKKVFKRLCLEAGVPPAVATNEYTPDVGLDKNVTLLVLSPSRVP